MACPLNNFIHHSTPSYFPLVFSQTTYSNTKPSQEVLDLEKKYREIESLVDINELLEAEDLVKTLSKGPGKSLQMAKIALAYLAKHELERAFLILKSSYLETKDEVETKDEAYNYLIDMDFSKIDLTTRLSLAARYNNYRCSYNKVAEGPEEKINGIVSRDLFYGLAKAGNSKAILAIFNEKSLNIYHHSKRIINTMTTEGFIDEALAIANLQEKDLKKYKLYRIIAVLLAELNNSKCLEIADQLPPLPKIILDKSDELVYLRGKTFYAIQVYAKDKSIGDRIFLDHSGYSKG